MSDVENAAQQACAEREATRLEAFKRRIGAGALWTLQLRTAEMLGFPVETCGHRACRRFRRCVWTRDGAPACLQRLLEEERPGYDEIFDYVVELYALARGQPCSAQLYLLLQQSPDYMPAAVEIVSHALPSGDRGHASIEEGLRDIYPVRHPRKPERRSAGRAGDTDTRPLWAR